MSFRAASLVSAPQDCATQQHEPLCLSECFPPQHLDWCPRLRWLNAQYAEAFRAASVPPSWGLETGERQAATDARLNPADAEGPRDQYGGSSMADLSRRGLLKALALPLAAIVPVAPPRPNLGPEWRLLEAPKGLCWSPASFVRAVEDDADRGFLLSGDGFRPLCEVRYIAYIPGCRSVFAGDATGERWKLVGSFAEA